MNKRIKQLNTGTKRLLLVIGIIVSFFPMLIDFEYFVDNPADIILGLIVASIIFVIYWSLIRIILWIIDGFKDNTNKEFRYERSTSYLPDLEELFVMEFKENVLKILDNTVQEIIAKNKSIQNEITLSLLIQSAVVEKCADLKKVDCSTISGTLGISEKEIHSIVDGATKEIMNKYFKSW